MNTAKNTSQNFFSRAFAALRRGMKSTARTIKRAKTKTMKGFTRWIDPKFAKYRTSDPQNHASNFQNHTSEYNNLTHERKNLTSDSQNLTLDVHNLTPTYENHTSGSRNLTQSSENLTQSSQKYTPQTAQEFFDLLKRTPRSVLNTRERHVIATIMNFPDIKVSEIMLPQSAITYVKDDEVLGPLALDRLYRSGFQHFPVINPDHRIIGIIHTTALNNLEIKETSRAAEILDPKVYYLREDYTLNQALAAFLRTNCYFFLVIDRYERILGMLTYQMLIDYILGETPEDDFNRDSDRLAVAKRKM